MTLNAPARTLVGPGDVVCTRNPKGWPARLIRLGAALKDKPNTVNHVIVVHHRDDAGVMWGIEGRPGGVGWVDMRTAMAGAYTTHNADQPKTPEQRVQVCEVIAGMLGTPYDWEGIALIGAEAVGVQQLWASTRWGTAPPAHVVCSALADWGYERVGLRSPAPDRTCAPWDWDAFNRERLWA